MKRWFKAFVWSRQLDFNGSFHEAAVYVTASHHRSINHHRYMKTLCVCVFCFVVVDCLLSLCASSVFLLVSLGICSSHFFRLLLQIAINNGNNVQPREYMFLQIGWIQIRIQKLYIYWMCLPSHNENPAHWNKQTLFLLFFSRPFRYLLLLGCSNTSGTLKVDAFISMSWNVLNMPFCNNICFDLHS